MAENLFKPGTAEHNKYDRGDNSGDSPLQDYWNGLSGKNTRAASLAIYDPTRPDEERGLGLQSRDQQLAFGNLLQAQMAGRGPSLAQTQLSQSRDDMIRSQLALAASGRGSNVALANRTAAQGGARIGMQAARDSAMIRAQEQLAAQQQYAALLQAQRQQDILARQLSTQEQLGQLQAKTAFEKGQMDVGEGEATRRQAAYGGVTNTVGSIFKMGSDPAMKMDAHPIGGDWALSPPDAKTNIQPVGQINRMDPYGPNMDIYRTDPYAGYGYSRQDISALTARPAQPAQQLNPYNLSLAPGQQPGQPANTGQSPQAQPQEDNFFQLGTVGGAPQQGGNPFSDPHTKTNAYALSPPQAKQNVSAGENLGRVAAQVQPYSFAYKPEFAAQEGVDTGQRVGAMATDAPGALDKNPVYGPSVVRGPDGLARVNVGQATMANIAVTSDLAREQEAMKSKFAELESLLAKEKAKNEAPRALRVHQSARGVDFGPTRDKAARQMGVHSIQMNDILTGAGEGAVRGGARGVEPIAFTDRDYGHALRMRTGVGRAGLRQDDQNFDEGNSAFTAPRELTPEEEMKASRGISFKAEHQIEPKFARISRGGEALYMPSQADEYLGNDHLEESAYGRRWRNAAPGDRTVAVNEMHENLMGDSAARINQAQSAGDRVNAYQALANALKSKHGGIVTPRMLEDEARKRGVKVKPGEVTRALSNEQSM